MDYTSSSVLAVYAIGVVIAIYSFIAVNISMDEYHCFFDYTLHKNNIYFKILNKEHFVRNRRIVCTLLPVAVMLTGLFYSRFPKLATLLIIAITFIGITFLMFTYVFTDNFYQDAKSYPDMVFYRLLHIVETKSYSEIETDEFYELYKACKKNLEICERIHMADALSGSYALVFLWICCI